MSLNLQTIKGVNYRLDRMDARMAFHVSRRLAPFMDGIIKAFRAGVEAGADVADSLAPVANALADMSDEQADYVLRHCLGVVKREASPGAWTAVTSRDGSLMFDDVSLAVMLALAGHVLKSEFEDFFSELQSLSAALRAPA